MTHLLDTNSCVDHLRRGQASNITAKLSAVVSGSVVLCSVVVAELLYGAHPQRTQQKTLGQVQIFCRPFQSLPFDDRAAGHYGVLPRHLAGLGMQIGPNDLLIASIALANGLTLVTHNTGEFSRVPGLKLEDWQ